MYYIWETFRNKLKKHSVSKIGLTIYCLNKLFQWSRPSALNFKSFSQSQGQLFLTVGQNNFGNKIPDLSNSTWLSISGNNWIYNYFTECIVGDITPDDGVSKEDKHSQEMNAMTILVKNLPTGRVSLEFFNAFERYVFSILMFLLYFWIFFG